MLLARDRFLMAPRLPVQTCITSQGKRMVAEGGQVTDAIKEMRVSVGSNSDLEGGLSAVRQWN